MITLKNLYYSRSSTKCQWFLFQSMYRSKGYIEIEMIKSLVDDTGFNESTKIIEIKLLQCNMHMICRPIHQGTGFGCVGRNIIHPICYLQSFLFLLFLLLMLKLQRKEPQRQGSQEILLHLPSSPSSSNHIPSNQT